MFAYDTLLQAIDGLKSRGYKTDFNLAQNCLVCNHGKFNVEDFEIVEVYRFEGDSNPSDESVVYGIESNTGLKGVLVSGYGISAEGMSAEMAKKLHIHRN
jgi:hypothetical protein